VAGRPVALRAPGRLIGIGILMIAYMLVVKPPGTLVVIFGRASTT